MKLFGKTRTAKIWGASDRIICVKGIAGETDEFNTTAHPNLSEGGYVATLRIDAGELGAMNIHAFYDGCWSFAVSAGDIEAESPPDWISARTWGTTNSHSETLELEIPKAATISAIQQIVGPL